MLVPPRLATPEELGLFHTEEYIEAVRNLSQGEKESNPRRYNFGPGDNPVWMGMYETEALKVGSTLVAAELVTSHQVDVAFSFSGGMHHAGPAFASGFCVFNDAAVAIHWLLQRGLRVAYIDIDAHHGDGVQDAFYETDQVLTISLHETGLYLFPGSGFVEEMGRGAGRGYAVNLPLAPYTDDEIYLWAFEQIVPRLVGCFQPDIVVSQLGVDTHYRDPLTHLCLTTSGYTAAVTTIKQLAPRWLALGGGGYDVDVVARSWTLAYGIMSGQEFPDDLPPSYAEKYGGGSLRDHEKPHISSGFQERARSYAEDSVAALKRVLAI
jgi:acetoin utilization protein AcuC